MIPLVPSKLFSNASLNDPAASGSVNGGYRAKLLLDALTHSLELGAHRLPDRAENAVHPSLSHRLRDRGDAIPFPGIGRNPTYGGPAIYLRIEPMPLHCRGEWMRSEVNVSEASELSVSPVVRDLLHSARQSLSPAQASTKRLIDQAISLLDRESSDESTRYGAGRLSGGLAPWQQRRVAELIDEHIASPLPVETLAASVKLSRCHFCRAFKKAQGISPHAYIMRRRVRKAQELMLATDEPLVRIALSCGLASQSHLCQIFRRVTGCSPSVWRRLHRLGDG